MAAIGGPGQEGDATTSDTLKGHTAFSSHIPHLKGRQNQSRHAIHFAQDHTRLGSHRPMKRILHCYLIYNIFFNFHHFFKKHQGGTELGVWR